jgi:RNA polymerase sigma-70 factor, ECF subfamily
MNLFPLSSLKRSALLAQPDDFARFYEQSHLSVFRYIMVLCAGNQAEAEDITAEAFFRAWEKRSQFSGSPSAALGWVIAIARNILIDQRRSEIAHPAEDSLEEEEAEPGTGIEAMLIGNEQIQQILDAMQSLPFAQHNLLTLRYVLNWQVKVIAAHLGMTENTVSVNLRRALAKVQSRLVLQEFNARRTAK